MSDLRKELKDLLEYQYQLASKMTQTTGGISMLLHLLEQETPGGREETAGLQSESPPLK